MKLIAAAALVAFASVAGAEPLTGVYVEDIDRKAEACTDFPAFANGAWHEKNPIPPSMVRWSRRWAAGELAKDQLHAILEEVSQNAAWPKGSVEQQIGDYYASCMDTARVEALGTRPLQPMLAEIDAVRDAKGVVRVIGRLHDLQIAAPFGFVSAPDAHQPSRVIADLFAAGLGLPDRHWYEDDDARFVEARAKYVAHVGNMLALSGLPADDAKKAAALVFAQEKALAGASLDTTGRRDPKAVDHQTTFDGLTKLAPRLDWAGYFDAAHLPRGPLNVSEPAFLREVDRQLAEVPLASWKAYLRWHYLRNASPVLSPPFVAETFSFYRAYLNGVQEMKPRWKQCVESTDHALGEALGRKYVEKHFPPAAKARMQDMVKNILLAMGDTVRGLDWMTPATKQKALEKLATFNPKIGYPDVWTDYRSVAIARDAFFENALGSERFAAAQDRARVGRPVDRGRFQMTPPTSNAYYNPLLNEIVFPAGILQPPGFRLEANDAVSYGAIGTVIGHEISHGFDDQGAQFDAHGRLLNWWTDADLKEFQARGQCVVDQFAGYAIEPGLFHNGRLVLGESIGDLAGVKIAYRAYLKSREGKGPEATVDGLTPEQQFFIGWGQFRGDSTRIETQRMMVRNDSHPVARFRVMGPLTNMPEFAKAFGCAADAPMVRPPAQRCEVW
jgi:endothelin-converting enzyme/putative endopeptidase